MDNDHIQHFNDFVHTQLNEQQLQAVLPKEGVFHVCAGAGSGKTRVITARIAHLVINEQVMPTSIVALTFTNKAAHEMKERVRGFLPAGTSLPYVGTFHSYCLQLLRIHGHLIGKSEFTVLDGSDQESLIKEIIKRYALTKKMTARTALSAISQVKNNAVNHSDTGVQQIKDPVLQQLYAMYEKGKEASHCLDFDDLLLMTLKLFQTQPIFKLQFQERIQHLLVDEYQDTNRVQHAILKEMTRSESQLSVQSLCVVGDEDQSIYSWRGATVSNMVNFKFDFPTTRMITIEQNYRSVQQILEVANHVIQYNTQRNPKNLWSSKTGNDRVRLLTCASSYQEGAIIALLAQQYQKKNGLNKLAVLYRSHYQSRSLEEALMHHSVPYKIIGGTQFYDRQEVKDLLSYLRLMNNPFDRISFMRCIGTPPRGLGDKFVEQFFQFWDQQPLLNFKMAIEACIDQELVTGTKKESLQDFVQLFTMFKPTDTVHTITETLIRLLEFMSYLKDSYDPEEARTRIENVKELLAAMKAAEERGVTSLADFLEEVALLQDHLMHKDDTQDYVKLMTLHSAKGLEFDIVALTGLEEGVLPSSHSLYQPESLEEERRLLYVGMTRARERLLLTASKYRLTYGQTTDQRPSRFIAELPKKFIQHHDGSPWNTELCKQYIIAWTQGIKQAPATMIPAQSFTVTIPKKAAPQKPTSIASSPSAAISKLSTIPSSNTATKLWKKHQPVSHETFGTGIIEQIDESSDQGARLTIRFKTGVKKISESFVTPA